MKAAETHVAPAMRATFAAFLILVCAPTPALAQIAFRNSAQAAATVLPPTTAPTFQAAGATVTGTANVTVVWPAHQAGDLGLLVCESPGANAVSTPAGFTDVANSPQSSTLGPSGGARISVFYARATSGAMPNVTVLDAGNHLYCQILTYRGVLGSGNPWDVTSGGLDELTTVTLSSVTTTVANTRVVQLVSRDQDSAGAAFSAPTNANLTGIAERSDAGTTSGNGGGIGVWDGVKATAGAIGTTTATATTSLNAYLTVALAPSGGTAPNFQAAGTQQSGVGGVTVPWPAHAINDVALLACESQQAEPVTLTTANGFVAVTNSPQSVAGTIGGTRLTVFWARATSTTMASPVVADPGDHVYCRILTYRGVVAAGNPWNITGGGVNNTVTVTGVTTTLANTRIVQIVARDDDSTAAGYSAITNGNLAGITERSDGGTVSGNGGGFAVWDGTKATAGATGNTTATVVTSVHAFVTLALPPDDGLRINVPATTAVGDLMVAAITVRPSTVTITTPPGWTAQAATVQPGATSSRQQIFYRIADAGDVTAGANHFWTFSAASTGAAGGIVSYSSVDTASASPFNAFAGNLTPQGVDPNTSHRALSVTTTVPNTMVISSYSLASSDAWTPPGGMAERVDIFSDAVAGGTGIAIEMNEVAQAATGATGDKIATIPTVANGDVGVAHLIALRPGLAHYAISAVSTTVPNCDYAQITISGHASNHGLVAPASTRTVTLSVSAGAATAGWQAALVSGAGIWTPSGATATYQWSGSETSFTVRLRQSAVTSLSVNLVDNFGTIEGIGAEDPTLSFVNSAFRISNGSNAAQTIATQIAAKPNATTVATSTYYLQAVRTDTTTGACQTVFANGSDVAIQVGAQCINPATCTQNVTLTTNSPASNSGTFVPAGAASFPATINFRFSTANAEAPFIFDYADAGQIHLQFNHVTAAPATTITGSSNDFVVRPFGFAFRGANAGTAIAHSNTATGALFAAAGDNFTMTLGAYKWASGQDSITAGVPNPGVNIVGNGLAPNFAASTTVSVSSNLPGVATGTLSRGVGCGGAATIAAGSWSGGAAVISDWCYSELGNIFLAATSNDYLSDPAADISGSSGLDGDATAGGYVGRFRPKQFAVSAATVTNRAALSCAPASTFTYMSERLDLGFTLTAQNTQGGTTQNYNGAYAKLVLTTFANLNLGARSGASNLTTRINSGTAPTGSWSNGVAPVAVQTQIVRAASPDGPYAATAFGIAPVDSDTVAMDTLDLDVDNNTVNDHKSLGVTTELRFGRLRVQNALASSGGVIVPMPIALQYWNAATSVFTTSSDDTCTVIASGSVTLAPTLSGGSTSVLDDPIPLSSGTGFIRLAAPGAGNTGFVVVTPSLPGHLQGNWTGGAWNQNPSARGTWGVFGGQPQNFIYQRENY